MKRLWLLIGLVLAMVLPMSCETPASRQHGARLHLA